MAMLRRYGLAGVCVLFVASSLFWGWISGYSTLSWTSVTFWVGTGLAAAAGLVCLAFPTQRGNGWLLLTLVSVLGVRSLLGQYPDTGVNAFLDEMLRPMVSVLIGHLMLRWPLPRLQDRPQRITMALSYTLLPATWLVWCLCWDPRWGGYTGPARWPTLIHSGAVYDVMVRIAWGLMLGLIGTFVVLVALRLSRGTRVERRELVPVAVTAAFVAATGALEAGGYLTTTPLPDPTVVQNLALCAIPAAFLTALIVRRVQRALAVEALLAPGRLATPEDVQQAVGRALGDKHLTLAFYSHERGGYLAASGQPALEVAQGRHPLYVPARDGTPVARFDLAPSLAARPELTESVARAATLALDTARLQAELRGRREEVDRVRRQLEELTEEGARLSRLVPGGLPHKLRSDPAALGRVDEAVVTVLMSDVRGYSGIAERSTPARLARQLNEHRAAMNAAILAEGGTVMQYVGDAVMAVFGAPFTQPDHADRAVRAAAAMHRRQSDVDAAWAAQGLEPFRLGIGLSTGPVATAVLGSEERYEYTIVGDTVNLAQRLESLARPGGTTIASAATVHAATSLDSVALQQVPVDRVEGREGVVAAFRLTS